MKSIPNPELLASGLFATFTGPEGGYPVQLEGTLTTGEYVYFRSRGRTASLTVSTREDGDELFKVSHLVTADDPHGASTLPVAKCVSLIQTWLACYLSTKS